MPNIYAFNKLTKVQLTQIHELEEVCRNFDKTKGNISFAHELNFHKDMDCFFLLEEEEKLIGVLTIFAPVKDEAEIYALIQPQHRRKGYFSALLKEALAKLKGYGIEQLYFVHDTGSIAGKSMIEKWGIDPDHSEYLLVCDKDFDRDNSESSVTIKQTEQEDLDDMVKLSLDVFGGDEEDWIRLHQKSLDSPNVLCYFPYLQGGKIGISSVNMTEQGFFIFGFGILSTFRRKGYGRSFLYKIVEELQSKFDDEILLEVDSGNNSAYMLYTTSGFKVKVQFDYYKRILSDI